MCLAIPVKIVSIEGDEAEAEIAGVRRRISIALTPEVKMGDYVLLHTGYANYNANMPRTNNTI
ncbi:unnamed protein product [marine sediment metagenome]|uniref:Hydrogenase assembly chaperone HypC/HupF n=1 Tax=marine sediment metagenome TaxID=412755 RepID=X1IL33_9ZZZZ